MDNGFFLFCCATLLTRRLSAATSNCKQKADFLSGAWLIITNSQFVWNAKPIYSLGGGHCLSSEIQLVKFTVEKIFNIEASWQGKTIQFIMESHVLLIEIKEQHLDLVSVHHEIYAIAETNPASFMELFPNHILLD